MGHGVKDEVDDTQIYFVTTGYLVRLLAHHPEAFYTHTHLIIDEVHERSVDGDILCLLARRLLKVTVTHLHNNRYVFLFFDIFNHYLFIHLLFITHFIFIFSYFIHINRNIQLLN